MEDAELFGELHEQEENGLYGKQHTESYFLQNASNRLCDCYFNDCPHHDQKNKCTKFDTNCMD